MRVSATRPAISLASASSGRGTSRRRDKSRPVGRTTVSVRSSSARTSSPCCAVSAATRMVAGSAAPARRAALSTSAAAGPDLAKATRQLGTLSGKSSGSSSR